jgi:hypothetical protein
MYLMPSVLFTVHESDSRYQSRRGRDVTSDVMRDVIQFAYSHFPGVVEGQTFRSEGALFGALFYVDVVESAEGYMSSSRYVQQIHSPNHAAMVAVFWSARTTFDFYNR